VAANKLKVGDLVTAKGYKYGYLKIKEFLPKKTGQAQMCKVLHCNNRNFNFGFVRTIRLVDLRPFKKERK